MDIPDFRRLGYTPLAGRTTGRVDVAYDDRGNCLVDTWLDEDGIIQRREMTYNGNGQLIREDWYNSDGGLFQYSIKEYDGDNVSREDWNGPDGLGMYRIYEYDESGKATKISKYSSDDTPIGTTTYDYNDNGTLLRESSYDVDGTLEWYNEFFYDQITGKYVGASNYWGDGTLNWTNTFS